MSGNRGLRLMEKTPEYYWVRKGPDRSIEDAETNRGFATPEDAFADGMKKAPGAIIHVGRVLVVDPLLYLGKRHVVKLLESIEFDINGEMYDDDGPFAVFPGDAENVDELVEVIRTVLRGWAWSHSYAEPLTLYAKGKDYEIRSLDDTEIWEQDADDDDDEDTGGCVT